jgi:ferredoxin, 2Fe-2S
MTRITFIASGGQALTVAGRDGDSVMQTAIINGVRGVIGECGGSMMCATCHCYVDEQWAEQTGARSDGEDEMLDNAVSEVLPTSRLSCQIKVTPALDGLVVRLPPAQQ